MNKLRKITCVGVQGYEDLHMEVGHLLALQGVSIITTGLIYHASYDYMRGVMKSGRSDVSRFAFTLPNEEILHASDSTHPVFTNVIGFGSQVISLLTRGASSLTPSPEIGWALRLGYLLSSDGYILTLSEFPETIALMEAIIYNNIVIHIPNGSVRKLTILCPTTEMGDHIMAKIYRLHYPEWSQDIQVVKTVNSAQDAVNWVLKEELVQK